MKLPNGGTCRNCKPDTGACDKHLHLDPCYQANVVEPRKKKMNRPEPCACLGFRGRHYDKRCPRYTVEGLNNDHPKTMYYYVTREGGVRHMGMDQDIFCGPAAWTMNRVWDEDVDLNMPICEKCIKEDARRKKPLWEAPVMIGPSPQGISVSWVELNTIHAALKKMVEDMPSGQILSTYAEAIWRRVDFQKKRNDMIIDHSDKYGNREAWKKS